MSGHPLHSQKWSQIGTQLQSVLGKLSRLLDKKLKEEDAIFLIPTSQATSDQCQIYAEIGKPRLYARISKDPPIFHQYNQRTDALGDEVTRTIYIVRRS